MSVQTKVVVSRSKATAGDGTDFEELLAFSWKSLQTKGGGGSVRPREHSGPRASSVGSAWLFTLSLSAGCGRSALAQSA